MLNLAVDTDAVLPGAVPSSAVTRLMLAALDLQPTDRLLEIGTGSGTQTDAWAATGCEVYSVELEPWMECADHTGGRVYLRLGDGREGLPLQAPFTAIVATCGVEAIPKAWREQLSDGGRLVCPIGDAKSQRLTLFRKVKGEMIPERVWAYVRFQMLKEPKAGKIPYRHPDEVSR
jgi:protein-L-isoaspartate(D-aspartate) O-methyltransferase